MPKQEVIKAIEEIDEGGWEGFQVTTSLRTIRVCISNSRAKTKRMFCFQARMAPGTGASGSRPLQSSRFSSSPPQTMPADRSLGPLALPFPVAPQRSACLPAG